MTTRLANRASRLRRKALGISPVRPVDQLAIPLASPNSKIDSMDLDDPAAGLSATPDHGGYVTPAATRQLEPGTLLAFARETYNIRRRRARFLPADLFGEPTWDILLDLYVATRENRPVPTTSACIGAHVPPTTALRWLRILEARGLVEREDDGQDGRRTFVRLSERGLAAMDEWLEVAVTSYDHAVSAHMRHGSDLNLPMAEAAE